MEVEPVLGHAMVNLAQEAEHCLTAKPQTMQALEPMLANMQNGLECCESVDCPLLSDCHSCQPCNAFSGLSASLQDTLLTAGFVIPATLNKSFVSISTLPHFRPPIRT